MKKWAIVIVVLLALILFGVGVASAAGIWQQGLLNPSDGGLYNVWFHTAQQGNILHLRDICWGDWSYCPRKTTVYNTNRFLEPPICEFEDGTELPAWLWDQNIYVEDMYGNVYADYPSAWVCWDYTDPWPVP